MDNVTCPVCSTGAACRHHPDDVCYVLLVEGTGTILVVYATWDRLVSGLGLRRVDELARPSIGMSTPVTMLDRRCRIECHLLTR